MEETLRKFRRVRTAVDTVHLAAGVSPYFSAAIWAKRKKRIVKENRTTRLVGVVHEVDSKPAPFDETDSERCRTRAKRSFYQTVSTFKTDKLNVPDDFEVTSIE